MRTRSRILLIDSSSILHIVKHAGAKRLKEKDKTSYILLGFLLKLQMYMQKTKPNLCVFATDSSPKDSLRKKIYPTYKLKRNTKEKTEEELALDAIAYPQFSTIEDEILPMMGYSNIFLSEGFEADDIIGKVCKTYAHCEIIIITSDEDMYQLLSPTVCILKPQTNSYFTCKMFKEKYGIEPKMWKRVKAIGGCFDKETEILTNRGWIYFNNLKHTDKVYSMDPTSRIANYEEITEIIKYKYNGLMYEIKGKLIDLLVTPNHKFFGSSTQSYPTKESKNVVRFKEIQEIVKYENFTIPITSEWEGITQKNFILPEISHNIKNRRGSFRTQTFPDLNIDMNIWLSFLGLWLSDGYVSKNRNGNIGTIGICASKERKLKYFQPILDATPWNWRRVKNQWKTDSKQLAEYLHKLGNAKTKFIPREFLNLSTNQLQILFDSIMAGDGCCSEWVHNVFGKVQTVNSMEYYSSSKKLINSFHELAIKLGHAVRITTNKPKKWNIKEKTGWSKESYTASILKSNNVNIIKGKNISLIPFDDYVFDVETKPNHTIFVRRNKHSVWSSNCTSDEVKGIEGVGEKTAIKYIKGILPKHHKTFKRIESKDGWKIINRNKALVILPFKGTPEYFLEDDRVSKIKVKGVAEKYKFKPILSDLENWTRILKGWGSL